MINLYSGDCLEVMDKLISEGVKVDAIITDPPYGKTACKWDSIIPFGKMWERLNKLIKHNGAIVLFGSEPFSSALRMSNIKNYKYDWVWDKKKKGGFLNAKSRPLKQYENIIIFANQKPIYYPLKEVRGKPRNKDGYNKRKGNGDMVYGAFKSRKSYNNEYYPSDIIEFSNANQKGKVHPTQKPVALLEYLIKTYTNENETVLDFTMGSGTTGVACKNTNRNFIGIELDETYYNIATERIEKAHEEKELFRGD